MRAVGLATVVCRLLGVLILGAVSLKGLALFSGAPADSPLPARWVEVVLVDYELAIGITLTLAPIRPWVWGTALVTFLLFACAATYEAASGAHSCGCFGRLRVDPWYTAFLDTLAVMALIGARYLRGVDGDPPARSRKRWLVTIVAAVAGMVAATLVASRGPLPDIAADGLLVSGKFVVLDPSHWLGKRFPLERQIDVGSRLMIGHWLVVLFRSDCQHCQRAIPRYEALAGIESGPLTPAVALIELPPLASDSGDAIHKGAVVLCGRIVDTREWLAQTPVRLEIADGKVIAVVEGEAAEFPPDGAEFSLPIAAEPEGTR